MSLGQLHTWARTAGDGARLTARPADHLVAALDRVLGRRGLCLVSGRDGLVVRALDALTAFGGEHNHSLRARD